MLANQRKILVVGDIMLDTYVSGSVHRISPEAPVPVLSASSDVHRPGGAANLAANISAMGGNVTLLAINGIDEASERLKETLSQFELTQHYITGQGARTTQKTRIVAAGQQIVRVDKDFLPGKSLQGQLLDEYKKVVSGFDVVVFSDYAKGSLDRLPEFISIARRFGKITLVDPKRKDLEFYAGATVLKPNNSEFINLFGDYSSDEELVFRGLSNAKIYQIENLVVTRGPKGMILLSSDGTHCEYPTLAQEVFDVSGAGDTVLAALAVELSCNRTLQQAVETSTIAAGIAVSRRGTYVVSRADIREKKDKFSIQKSKIVNMSELEKIINLDRNNNRRIIFTNGCFDILHPGHVRLLNAAKKLGDVLILGLNSDASVRRSKGPQRPINTFEQRSEVLSALSSVDYIIEFDEDTPLKLISFIKPDVLVKGGDYKLNEIIGHDIVIENGGSVHSLEFHDGYSTTKLISKIENKI